MTVLHDYEAASVQGILLVGSDERLRPGDAETLRADVDEDGRVGLTSLQITLLGHRSDPVVATVTPTAGRSTRAGGTTSGHASTLTAVSPT